MAPHTLSILTPLVICAASLLPTSTFAQTSSSSGAFNILSLNVAGLPEFLQNNDIDESKTNTTAQIGQAFAKGKDIFDIINVQEDFNYHATLYEYDDHEFRTPTSGGAAVGSGLNTLANYDWIDFERVEWDKCSGYLDQSNDCLTPKGFTFMRMRIEEGVYVDIVNLHTDAGTSDADEEARNSNVNQVLTYLSTSSQSNPIIMFGDTNSRYTRILDTAIRNTTTLGLSDPWIDIIRQGSIPQAGADALLCDNPSENNTCEVVDKIFYRGSKALNLSAVDWSYVSELFVSKNGSILTDHNPVMVNFTYNLSDELRQSDLFGGPHGEWYNDLESLSGGAKMANLTLNGDERLDGISCSSSEGGTITHGGDGGDVTTLNLNEGEYVNKATLCQGKYNDHTRIFYGEFTTSANRTVSAGTQTDDCTTMQAPGDGWGMVGAYGRAGDEVDMLGLIWGSSQ